MQEWSPVVPDLYIQVARKLDFMFLEKGGDSINIVTWNLNMFGYMAKGKLRFLIFWP